MKTVELFCGTKSFSKVAKRRGHATFTSDFLPEFKPDLCANILTVKMEDLPDDIDILWLSPPCTCFSIASVSHHWNKNRTPKSADAAIALKILTKCVDIIKAKKPRYWFMENPRGMMRKMPQVQGLHRLTVTYCQYGDMRMKPTDIWTNTDIVLKPMCHNGDPCHEAAPRGAKTGTQGLKGAKERSVVPPGLVKAVIKYCEEKEAGK